MRNPNLKPLAEWFHNVNISRNPTQENLREIALEQGENVFRSACGNLNKITREKSRKAELTYIIGNEGDKQKYSGKLISREKADSLIAVQRKYIEKKGSLICIEGYLGLGKRAVPVEWLYTPESANVAGMQQILAFSRESVEGKAHLAKLFDPQFRLVFTGGCALPDMPGKLAIVVDLANYITYVIGSDYFGESKKGALRMLCDYAYKQGGLVMHAGAKEVKEGSKTTSMAVMGLSGTGKTTTTFSKQGDFVAPVQDDMITLWPSGEYSVTENGCFAKTWDLKPETEPAIYYGTVDAKAWCENVYMDKAGNYDFGKGVLTADEVKFHRSVLISTVSCHPQDVDAYIQGKVMANDVVNENGVPKDGWDFVGWSQNGRSIIPLASIENAADLTRLTPIRSLGILNRDEGKMAATPGLVKFKNVRQAAVYIMLGETSKTSAAGKERGKTRSPFTQPFFPLSHGLQPKRFANLAATMPALQLWLMNTGYVGGDDRDVKSGRGYKVKIKHSSLMLEALLKDEIVWKEDPDFHYLIVDVESPANRNLLEAVPREILNPRLFFEKNDQIKGYQEWVETIKTERREFLRSTAVDEEIVREV
jgi:phosphoenolpyruvate carboxykinase (ATP)